MQLETFKKLVADVGKAKAMLLIDGEEVVDADGAAVDLEVIEGKTQSPPNSDDQDPPVNDGMDEKSIKRIVADAMKDFAADQKTARKALNLDQNDDKPKQKSIKASVRGIPVPVKSFKSDPGRTAEFKAYAFGRWAQWNYSNGSDVASAKWLVENDVMTKAQFENQNLAGGALVPDEFMPELIRLVEMYGVARQECRVVPMTREKMSWPRRTGGLTATWEGESTSDSQSSITKSSATFDNINLIAKKLMALTLVSSELMEDSAVSVGDVLADEIALAFAEEEDDALFNGNGASTYGGIQGILPIHGAGSRVTAATGNTAFSTLDLADFHNVFGKLPQYALRNAKWYISQAGYAASMQRLAHAQGGNTVVETENGMQLRFLGYPVVISQKLNATLTAQTSTNICCFGDLTQGTLFGDRSSADIKISEDRYFDTDQIAVRGRERLDITVHSIDDATTAGPIIVLQTPAS